jgi:hypothetical protein
MRDKMLRESRTSPLQFSQRIVEIYKGLILEKIISKYKKSRFNFKGDPIDEGYCMRFPEKCPNVNVQEQQN